jgi:hypothetical protein
VVPTGEVQKLNVKNFFLPIRVFAQKLSAPKSNEIIQIFKTKRVIETFLSMFCR